MLFRRIEILVCFIFVQNILIKKNCPDNLNYYTTISNSNVIFASNNQCIKRLRVRSYSGPCFPAFRLNTERMQSKCRKIRTRITRNTDAFQAVNNTSNHNTLNPNFNYDNQSKYKYNKSYDNNANNRNKNNGNNCTYNKNDIYYKNSCNN